MMRNALRRAFRRTDGKLRDESVEDVPLRVRVHLPVPELAEFPLEALVLRRFAVEVQHLLERLNVFFHQFAERRVDLRHTGEVLVRAVDGAQSLSRFRRHEPVELLYAEIPYCLWRHLSESHAERLAYETQKPHSGGFKADFNGCVEHRPSDGFQRGLPLRIRFGCLLEISVLVKPVLRRRVLPVPGRRLRRRDRHGGSENRRRAQRFPAKPERFPKRPEDTAGSNELKRVPAALDSALDDLFRYGALRLP